MNLLKKKNIPTTKKRLFSTSEYRRVAWGFSFHRPSLPFEANFHPGTTAPPRPPPTPVNFAKTLYERTHWYTYWNTNYWQNDLISRKRVLKNLCIFHGTRHCQALPSVQNVKKFTDHFLQKTFQNILLYRMKCLYFTIINMSSSNLI